MNIFQDTLAVCRLYIYYYLLKLAKQAYETVMTANQAHLQWNKEFFCLIHERLMYTSRFDYDYQQNSTRCVPTGLTRTETNATVVIRGEKIIECCPPGSVDNELSYICNVFNNVCATLISNVMRCPK